MRIDGQKNMTKQIASFAIFWTRLKIFYVAHSAFLMIATNIDYALFGCL
jgi:hypothetical protein